MQSKSIHTDILYSAVFTLTYAKLYPKLTMSVFVAVGLFRLQKHVKKLSFFDRKPLLNTVPFISALGNVSILVFAVKTKIREDCEVVVACRDLHRSVAQWRVLVRH